MHRISLTTLWKEKELWFLVLLTLLYFYRVIFLDETFFVRDLSGYFFPQKQLLLDFLHAREWPLWNSYLNGGQVYLANITTTALYPFNLLYLCLPALRAFNLNIVLHIMGCAVLTYIFARLLGLSPISSFISGIVYGFCGHTLSLVNLHNQLLAMAYLPGLCAGWHLVFIEKRRRWFAITVLLAVLQVLAGAPEINVISFLVLLGWSLVYPYKRPTRLQRCLLWGLLGIFTLGIAAIQLLPIIEILPHSTRGKGFDYAGFSQWSIHPGRLPELILPGLLGHFDQSLDPAQIWGKDLFDTKFPYFISIYVGGIAIAFGILGGFSKNTDDDCLPRQARRFLMFLFLGALLFSLGRFLPFFHAFYQSVPFMRSFRYPAKMLALGTFPLAILVGYTAEQYFGRACSPEQAGGTGASRPHLLICFLGIASVFTGFTVLFWNSPTLAEHVLGGYFHQAGNPIARAGIRSVLIRTTAIWGLMTLVYCARHLRQAAWQHWALAGIMTCDLLSAGSQVNPSMPQELLTKIPPVVPEIRQHIGDGRLFQFEHHVLFMSAPTSDIMWQCRFNLETLVGIFPVFYRIPGIFQIELVELTSQQVIKMDDVIRSVAWQQRLPFLSAARVTLILTDDKIDLPGVQFLAEIPNASNAHFYLYRNDNAVQRVEFATYWTFAASADDAIRVMLQPNYDPRQYVVLQRSEPTPSESAAPDQSTAQAPPPETPQCEPARLQQLSATTHAASFAVSTQCDGYLVFSEPFYPEWHIFVDNKRAPVLWANVAFSAIFLPAGEHIVERRYQPQGLWYGTGVSLLFGSMLCVIVSTTWIQRRLLNTGGKV